MTGERLNADERDAYIEQIRRLGRLTYTETIILAVLDACRDELAAATEREARLRDALEWSLIWTPKRFETPLVQSWRDKADALLAESDTTKGEEGQ